MNAFTVSLTRVRPYGNHYSGTSVLSLQLQSNETTMKLMTREYTGMPLTRMCRLKALNTIIPSHKEYHEYFFHIPNLTRRP